MKQKPLAAFCRRRPSKTGTEIQFSGTTNMKVGRPASSATKATFALVLALTVALGAGRSLLAGATPCRADLCRANSIALTTIGIRLPVLPVPSENWMPVPNWLAGTWWADNEIILESRDYTGTREASPGNPRFPLQLSIKRTSVIGTQRDAGGQIWHLASAPYTRTTETASFIEKQQIQSVRLLERNPKMVKIATAAIVTRTSKDSDESFAIFKEDTTTTYQPVEDGIILVTFEINDSDLSGRQLSTSKALSVELRVKNFVTVDRDQRGDLKQEFRDYLESRSLQNLIPGSSQ